AGLGDSLPGVLGSEMAAACLVLGLPSGLMGATFSYVTQRAAQARSVGTASALNTFGAAAAVGVFGVWLLPHLGLKGTLLVITVGYLLCLPAIRSWRWAMALL